MFKLMREGWILTKGVTEVVQTCDCWRVDRREQTVQSILGMARNMKMPTSGLPPHQQVMLVCWLAIAGIGPGGASYADGAIRRYAEKHGETEAVEEIAVSGRELARRAYGYSERDMAPYERSAVFGPTA